MSVNGNVYARIYPPGGGFASLETDLGLKNADKLRTGTPLAPFDREVSIQSNFAGSNLEMAPL